MELYEMTLKQYREHLLNTSKYKQVYTNKPQLWEQKLEEHKKQWEALLLERAKFDVIPSDVIQSYIRTFGEKRLHSLFRGVHQKGISNFRIPKKIRDLRQ